MASSTSAANSPISSTSIANIAYDSPLSIFATPIHLKLDDDNYPIWKQQVLVNINSLNLTSFLEPPVPSSSSDTPSLPDAYHQQDQAIVAWLLSLMTPSMMTKMVGFKTSYEIWHNLKLYYSQTQTQTRSRDKLKIQPPSPLFTKHLIQVYNIYISRFRFLPSAYQPLSPLLFITSFGTIYLLILDSTNWRTNILTALLMPYIFFSFPDSLFYFLRGEVGKCIAIVADVLRLFFPRHFPDWMEIPSSMILMLTLTPEVLAHKLRNKWVGLAIDLFIPSYLLQEHIRTSGGFRNSFTQKHGISNTLAILLLIVYPICAFIIQ